MTALEMSSKRKNHSPWAREYLWAGQHDITRGSGCGQPQAGSALNEMLKLNLNEVDCNMFKLNRRSQIIS